MGKNPLVSNKRALAARKKKPLSINRIKERGEAVGEEIKARVSDMAAHLRNLATVRDAIRWKGNLSRMTDADKKKVASSLVRNAEHLAIMRDSFLMLYSQTKNRKFHKLSFALSDMRDEVIKESEALGVEWVFGKGKQKGLVLAYYDNLELTGK